MTIDERLDWLISISKCSDSIARQDVRELISYHAKMIKEQLEKERDYYKRRMVNNSTYFEKGY